MFLGMLLLIATYGARRWLATARATRTAVLARAAPLLVGGELIERGWTWSTLSGERDGRAIAIDVRTRPSWSPGRRSAIEARLLLRHAPPVHLRVRRDAGWAALEKALGLVRDVEVADGGRFDRSYLVELEGDEEADGALRDPAAREGIGSLVGRWRLQELALEGDRLVVRGTTAYLGRQLLYDLIDTLDLLGRSFDRSPIQVQRAGPARYAWHGGEEAARCPYCHDALDFEQEDVAACSVCGTVLHGECQREHGSCPILGCRGKGIEPLGPLRI